MNSITIKIPLPPKELGQNSRTHWAKKARATKAYRRTVRWITNAAILPHDPPRWKKARAEVKAFYPTLNAPDPINCLDRLKAAFDGIEDSGLIENDKGLWPERPIILKDAKNPRIEITITEEL